MAVEIIKDGALIVALERTGFAYEMPSDKEEWSCDHCLTPQTKLYHGKCNLGMCDDGEYLCDDCVIKLFIANEQAISES